MTGVSFGLRCVASRLIAGQLVLPDFDAAVRHWFQIDSGCSLCAQADRRRPELGEAPTSIERHLLHRARNPGAGSDLSYAGTCEGEPYFSWSATLATPALAQASSCSCVDPELPTPPIASLPIMIGTPPPKARMSATSRCAAYLGSSVRF